MTSGIEMFRDIVYFEVAWHENNDVQDSISVTSNPVWETTKLLLTLFNKKTFDLQDFIFETQPQSQRQRFSESWGDVKCVGLESKAYHVNLEIVG